MTDMQKVDREWMHKNNQKLILKAVLEEKECSKAQIAARTGMSVVSVGRITDELIAMGLLRETGGEAVPGQKAGRPAKRLALPLERLQCVCVALELQGIHLGLVDPYGTLRNRTWIPFPKETPLIQEEVMPWLARNLEQFFRENRKVRPLRWIGMVVQGIVDARRGEVVLTSRGWRNVPAVRYLEEHLPGCRVLLENETRATALAECTLGRAAEDQNAVVLNLGESVNAAIVLDGALYRGGDGWAGEIGHVIVEPDGAPCICGQRGCLRTKLALGPVLEKVRRIYPGVDLAGLVEYAQRGEPEAQALVDQVADYACVAISLTLNAYAPERVILCGSTIWDAPALRECIQRRCWERMGRYMPYPVPICADTFGRDGRLIGGGIQAFQQALEDILAGAEPGRTAMEPEKN